MDITIEKATATDAAELLEFFKKIGGETDNLTFGEEGIPISVERETKYLESMENSKDHIMLLAKENGKIIGDASLDRLSRRMSHRGDLGIAISKEYWNKGIGSQLLRGIIDFAKDNEFEIVELQVRSDNISAIHLYEKYGFKKIGTHPAFFKIGNEYIDFDYMCLSLK